MTNIVIVTLSPNEYTLQNTIDLMVYYKGMARTLPAGATLYFEDAGSYEINTAATEDYASAYFNLLIEATVPDDGDHPNRVIINKQAEIQALKANLTRSVDLEAEGTRLRFITDGAGQALTYDRKKDQALAFIAAYGSPGFDENDYRGDHQRSRYHRTDRLRSCTDRAQHE